MKNIVPSHLADAKAFDFQALAATGIADENGDKAFDADEACATSAAPASGIPAAQIVSFV
jgi:tRNA 2-thiocytidine biosynthesis protein TtcA